MAAIMQKHPIVDYRCDDPECTNSRVTHDGEAPKGWGAFAGAVGDDSEGCQFAFILCEFHTAEFRSKYHIMMPSEIEAQARAQAILNGGIQQADGFSPLESEALRKINRDMRRH
jgi:hypothetical protein